MEDIKKKHQIEQLNLTTLDGNTLSIGKGSSKPTLLLFFTTVCSSCQKAAPAISKQLEPLKEHLQLVAVGREHSEEELIVWAKENKLVFHLVADPERQLFARFAKMHVPRIYLIDTDGRVKYQDVNWHPLMLGDIQDAVYQLLQKNV
ncbi:MAG: TlpA disulfide reductase family protein [Aureispira sp.]